MAEEAPFDGKRLFGVEIEESIYVLAADESEAKEIAQEQASCGGDIDWGDADYSVQECDGRIAADWAEAVPHGIPLGMKHQTCQQILNAWAEYEAAKPPTQAELEGIGQQRLI